MEEKQLHKINMFQKALLIINTKSNKNMFAFKKTLAGQLSIFNRYIKLI